MSCLLFAFSFLLLPYLGSAKNATACGKCPSGFTHYSEVNKCFKAFSTPQTWDKASATCLSLNSHLVTIMSPCTNSALNSVVQTFKSLCYGPFGTEPSFWTSGRRKCGNDTFAWMPARGLALGMPYTNWLKGEPNNLNYAEDCLHFLAPNDKNLVWNDTPCNLLNCFVCEIDL